MAKVSEAQLKAQNRYDKTNTKGLYLKLNIKSDADIIEWLGEQSNRQGYIKSLIRSDMKLAE